MRAAHGRCRDRSSRGTRAWPIARRPGRSAAIAAVAGREPIGLSRHPQSVRGGSPPPGMTSPPGNKGRWGRDTSRGAGRSRRRRSPGRRTRERWGSGSLPVGRLRRGLAFVLSSSHGVDPRLRGDPVSDTVKPARQGVFDPEGSSLAGEHQESRLERVLGVMLVAEHAAADTQHHRPVPLDQHLERGIGTIVLPGENCSISWESVVPPTAPESEQLVEVSRDTGVPIHHLWLLRTSSYLKVMPGSRHRLTEFLGGVSGIRTRPRSPGRSFRLLRFRYHAGTLQVMNGLIGRRDRYGNRELRTLTGL